MSTKEEEQQTAIQNMFDMAEHMGVAVRSVKDGKLIVFKRAALQRILDQFPDRDTLVIFAQDIESASAQKRMS